MNQPQWIASMLSCYSFLFIMLAQEEGSPIEQQKNAGKPFLRSAEQDLHFFGHRCSVNSLSPSMVCSLFSLRRTRFEKKRRKSISRCKLDKGLSTRKEKQRKKDAHPAKTPLRSSDEQYRSFPLLFHVNSLNCPLPGQRFLPFISQGEVFMASHGETKIKSYPSYACDRLKKMKQFLQQFKG